MTLTLNQGFWSPVGGGGGSDPLWDDVLLLLTGTEQLGSSSISFSNLTTTTSGKWGDGYVSSSSNYALGNSALIPSTAVFSIEFWVQIITTTFYGGFLSQYSAGYTNPGRLAVQQPASGTTINMQIGSNSATSSSSIGTGTWAWIQLIKDTAGATPTNGVKIYIDGTLEAQFTPSAAVESTNFVIGAGHDGGGYKSNIYFDDFRVTAGVRTDFNVPTGPLPTS